MGRVSDEERLLGELVARMAWFVMCIAGATAGSLGGRRMARAASAAPLRAVPARVWDCGQLLAYTAGGDRLKFSMEGGERTGGSADSEHEFAFEKDIFFY